MHKSIFLALLASHVLLATACRKNDDSPGEPEPCDGVPVDTSTLQRGWITDFGPGAQVTMSCWPRIWNGQLLYWYGSLDQQRFGACDAATGAKLWEMPTAGLVGTALMYLAADKLYYLHDNSLRAIDLQTRTAQTVLSFPTGWLLGEVTGHDDMLLLTHSNYIQPGSSDTLETRIYLVDAATGEYRTVHHTRKPSWHDVSYHHVVNPRLSVTAAGDTVLGWLETLKGSDANDEIVFFLWRNLSTGDSTYATLPNAQVPGPYNRARVHDDRFYYCLDKTLHVFSATTGRPTWRFTDEAVRSITIRPRPVTGGVLAFTWEAIARLQSADGSPTWQQPRTDPVNIPDNGIERTGRYFYLDGDPEKLAVLDLTSGCALGLHPLPDAPADTQPLTALAWSDDGQTMVLGRGNYLWSVKLPD